MTWPAHLSTSRVLVLNRLTFTPQTADDIRQGSLLHYLTDERQVCLRFDDVLNSLMHLKYHGLAFSEMGAWGMTDEGVFAAIEHGPFGEMKA